jgi:hypothetical protein
MGRKSGGIGGWVVVGLFAFAFAKCGGDTKTSAPPPAPSQTAAVYVQPSVTPPAPAPVPVAVTPAPPARSLFSEPTTDRYLAKPEVVLRPIKRSLYVTGKEVPIRDAPNGKAKLLDRLPSGMEVGELSRREGWVEVRHPISAVEGWMSTRRLSTKAPATETDEDEAPEVKPKGLPGVLDTAAIAAALIARSIASYPGNCACPYHEDRAGRSCGRRSAHSRGGGRAPLCYPDDITPAMVANFRQSRR